MKDALELSKYLDGKYNAYIAKGDGEAMSLFKAIGYLAYCKGYGMGFLNILGFRMTDMCSGLKLTKTLSIL